MCDPPSGRRRMGACETTPTTTRDRGNQPSGPSHTQPAERLFLASDRRPPLAGIKPVRPRPRLPGAALRALQLDPGLARRHKPAATRKATIKVHPSPGGRGQVTGSTQHGLLTAGAPMGAKTRIKMLLQELAGHDHALDLVGALVDLGDLGTLDGLPDVPGQTASL